MQKSKQLSYIASSSVFPSPTQKNLGINCDKMIRQACCWHANKITVVV